MLQLVRFPVCGETVSVLRVLLKLALRGELRGLALCYRERRGGDHVILAGMYRAHPESSFAAAVRIKVAAAHQLDLFA